MMSINMNLQENIKRILREDRKLSNFLKRRLENLDYEVDSRLNNTFGGVNICIFFKSEEDFFETIMEESIDSMYYNYFSNIDDNSGEWAHVYLDMVNYIRKNYQYKIMKHYDDNCGSGLIPLKESIRKVLKEEMELNQDKRVYDYDKERNTVPERLPFDIDKLVNSGVVFVTPAIDGDPNSKTYKEWLEEPYTHLLTLYNVEHSSEDGWILKAITKVAPTEQHKNFVDKIYDGKYNQILWGLEKLGINPTDMLIDTNLQENIRRVLREESEDKKLKLVKSIIYNMFDNIINLEYNTERNEITVYYDKQEELDGSEICDTINNFTGLNVVLWYDYKKRMELKKKPDFYLDTERYEEELNESVNKSEDKKLKLVKSIIYNMFDNVSLEYDSKANEILIYHDKEEKLEISEICDTINDFTGLNVVPWFEYDKNRIGKEPDFYLDIEEYEE